MQRFDLKTLYDRDTMEETRETLADNTSISTGKDGIVAIAFDDEDPKRAADVANAYVEELDRLNRSLAVTEAAQRRLFFEQQLRQARDDLSDAEIRLKVTQERTGVIKLDDQGRAMIEAVAALRGQIAAKEVEIRALRTFATESNADLVRSQQELVGLRTELAKLERTPFFESGSVLVPMGKVPEVGLEYLRKVRDVKYHETIFEVIAKQYEAARIDEAKESSIVQIVDRAVAPDRKSKPKRSIIVIVVALLIGFIASIFAVLAEGYQRLEQDPRDARRLELLRFNLRRWRS
ncbi:MAG: GNVR domain-containing protein [Nitrospiraceae bacterium]